jgi:hypothetical protein
MALIPQIQSNGQVYIYENGNYKTCIQAVTNSVGGGVVNASIQGDECVVSFRDGSAYVCCAITGNYKFSLARG